MEPVEKVSDQIERWVGADGPRTLGSLVELFEEKSFAVIFVLFRPTVRRRHQPMGAPTRS